MKAKLIISAFLLAALAACSGGGSSNANKAVPADTAASNNTGSAGGSVSSGNVVLKVGGDRGFASNKEMNLDIDVSSLGSDEVIYLSVKGDDIRSGALLVSPEKSVAYPTDGKVNLKLNVKDVSLNGNSSFDIEVTTATNLKLKHTVTVSSN